MEPQEREGTQCKQEVSGGLLILPLPEAKCLLLAGRRVVPAFQEGGVVFFMPVEMTTHLKLMKVCVQSSQCYLSSVRQSSAVILLAEKVICKGGSILG